VAQRARSWRGPLRTPGGMPQQRRATQNEMRTHRRMHTYAPAYLGTYPPLLLVLLPASVCVCACACRADPMLRQSRVPSRGCSAGASLWGAKAQAESRVYVHARVSVWLCMRARVGVWATLLCPAACLASTGPASPAKPACAPVYPFACLSHAHLTLCISPV
jgi:hypothetical protein